LGTCDVIEERGGEEERGREKREKEEECVELSK